MALILVFVNKSDLAAVSDYDVEVLIGDGTVVNSRTIHRQAVYGHVRADGWEVLVQRMLNEHAAQRATTPAPSLPAPASLSQMYNAPKPGWFK